MQRGGEKKMRVIDPMNPQTLTMNLRRFYRRATRMTI